MRHSELIEQSNKHSDTDKCPPATQDIKLNLENRQKAIDEFGYGPLNPDLPNTKFWMKKVREWNLDSTAEAKQSRCGNCAAFDQRPATLICISQGMGSDQGTADPTIQAGDLGYCRFLKFKCASERTCDAWVSGGPLTEQGKTQGKQPGKLVIDAIQKVLPIAQEIWFHGSRATGKHRRNSDTDILVVVPDDIVGHQYLAVVKILEKLSAVFDNYDIQATHPGHGIHLIAQEEGQLLWSNNQNVVESWSEKYKHSIDCSNPKGFSQRAHCAGKKNNESTELFCPHCDGELVSEELMLEKQDACYYKVKSRYKVWPSAYASGALVTCRKKGVKNWGAKNESSILTGMLQVDENLKQWFKEKWVRFGPDGKIRGDCARGDDSEGKPKCLPQSKAHSLGKKGRASAAARKRRQDPSPDRSGKAINVNTKQE
jgi:predicted nucleotidyltransferase